MGNLENSEDPDEIHQGLHCLLTLKQLSGTEKHHDLGTSTCDPIKYTRILRIGCAALQNRIQTRQICRLYS